MNNLLEFIGMAVNIWIECARPDSSQDCILAIGDNTSAIGWLHNTSRLDPSWPAHKAHLIVARHIASLLINHDCCLGTQHIKGELNVVADLLSFVGGSRGKPYPLAFDDPPNNVLTERFHLSSLSNQIPSNFWIRQLPDEMLSWTSHVLQTAASSLTAAKRVDTKMPIAFGADGGDSALPPDTQTTRSSLCYPSTNVNSSSEPSFNVIGLHTGLPTASLLDTVRDRWWLALSAKPQATWLRRFGVISGQAPFTSRAAPTSVPSSARCSKHSRTRTHPSYSKEPVPQNS